LDRFCGEKGSSEVEHKHKLRGVVCHIGGTASSGHYTANCERISGSNDKTIDWASFDDGVNILTSVPNVLESERHQRTVYMLLYALQCFLIIFK